MPKLYNFKIYLSLIRIDCAEIVRIRRSEFGLSGRR